MQTTADSNPAATTTFIHHPRPAIVAAEPQHSYQRRYGHAKPGGYRLRPATDNQLSADLMVYRDGGTDVAELQTALGVLTSAALNIRLTPTELRELAARLIDAAHDIEAFPAAARQGGAA